MDQPVVTELSPDFQRSVLRLCMEDEAFCLKAMKHVTCEYFSTKPLGWVFTAIERYWKEYGSRCTDMALRTMALQQGPENAVAYASEAELVIAKGSVPDADFVKYTFAEFIRFHLFVRAHRKEAELMVAGKRTDAYDLHQRTSEEIHDISFGEVDRQWFFEEYEERQARRRLSATSSTQSFGTGIRELDEATEGGVKLGELWCVFAYAKRCKTTWLLNQVAGAMLVEREPALHFVLEGTGKQIAARYDACFAAESYRLVKAGEISMGAHRYLLDAYRELQSKLVIRVMNDWDINVTHLEAEIKDLRASNFKPKLVVVDYMDLLRSRNRVDSETQHQVDAARDLKRLVNNLEVACWSAWQAQRPVKGAETREHVLTSANVADAYAKVRIVDAYGSLNATEEEMSKNQMRVYMEGHRDAPMGRCWKIVNDLETMKMILSAETYNIDTSSEDERPKRKKASE